MEQRVDQILENRSERLMIEIRAIYQRWLEGDLAQEDALFAIGDLLHMDGQHSAGVAEDASSSSDFSVRSSGA